LQEAPKPAPKQEPTEAEKKKRLERAEKNRDLWEKIYEPLYYRVVDGELEGHPDKEKLMELYKESEKKWRQALVEVREARDGLKSDAQVLSEARLLHKILSA
jgi:hypothetical protein